ncbi:hypothetical protein GWD52_01780 [Enterobacteriaceae bacterium 4M9]|nr:hypothetical protein [Enterobacteriaceae bacterium 4M9]
MAAFIFLQNKKQLYEIVGGILKAGRSIHHLLIFFWGKFFSDFLVAIIFIQLFFCWQGETNP